MRKYHLYLLIVLFLLFVPAYTAQAADTVTVTLPDFPIKLNTIAIDNAHRQYPFIQYQELTYFPLTAEDCNFMGLKAQWQQEQGLVITVDSTTFVADYKPQNTGVANPHKDVARIADFSVTVCGQPVDQANTEYPFLIYRDVTYCPLEYEYAFSAFKWAYSFHPADGLQIACNYPIDPQRVQRQTQPADFAKITISTATIMNHMNQFMPSVHSSLRIEGQIQPQRTLQDQLLYLRVLDSKNQIVSDNISVAAPLAYFPNGQGQCLYFVAGGPWDSSYQYQFFLRNIWEKSTYLDQYLSTLDHFDFTWMASFTDNFFTQDRRRDCRTGTILLANGDTRAVTLTALDIKLTIEQVTTEGQTIPIVNYKMPVQPLTIPGKTAYNGSFPEWPYCDAQGKIVTSGDYRYTVTIQPFSYRFAGDETTHTVTLEELQKLGFNHTYRRTLTD